ncbi:MAG: hypothetical protein R2752_18845 [Vicinamibacterales bacterium]
MAALERILAERGLTGWPTPPSLESTSERQQEYVFIVTGAGSSLALCAVRFAGTGAIAEADLQSVVVADRLGMLYSRAGLLELAAGTLTRLPTEVTLARDVPEPAADRRRPDGMRRGHPIFTVDEGRACLGVRRLVRCVSAPGGGAGSAAGHEARCHGGRHE